MKSTLSLFLITLLFTACGKTTNDWFATGTFEADETVISSESAGVLKEFTVKEGDLLKKGMQVGYTDSTQLWLKRQQIDAQIEAVKSRKPNIKTQLAALQQQLETAQTEKIRIDKLVQANAATSKQADDINAQIAVIKKQIQAMNSSLSISTESLDAEINVLENQALQLDDQLQKSKIINPINGTVLVTYAQPFEMTAPGKPLYKIANLTNLNLRVFVSGNQLAVIKLNQKVKIRTDNGADGFNLFDGEITWISSKSEFTPKTIQTKEERTNRVYAVKIRVKNDGLLKIGQYGELMLNEVQQ
jgi:HlyD family secretion protein